MARIRGQHRALLDVLEGKGGKWDTTVAEAQVALSDALGVELTYAQARSAIHNAGATPLVNVQSLSGDRYSLARVAPSTPLPSPRDFEVLGSTASGGLLLRRSNGDIYVARKADL